MISTVAITKITFHFQNMYGCYTLTYFSMINVYSNSYQMSCLLSGYSILHVRTVASLVIFTNTVP